MSTRVDQLLFLDEPTSGVDPAGRRDFWALLRQLTEDGTTVVVSTHIMAEADRCDRLALLADGRRIAVGTPPELCGRTGLRILRIQTVEWQATYEYIKARWPEATLHGTVIHLPRPAGDDQPAQLASLFARLPVTNVDTASPTVEDASIGGPEWVRPAVPGGPSALPGGWPVEHRGHRVRRRCHVGWIGVQR